MAARWIDGLPLVFFAMGVAVERLFSGRRYPHVPWWWLKGIVLFVAGGAVAGGAGTLAVGLVTGLRLLDGSRLGLAGGAAAGLLVQTFAAYWMHRAFHRYGVLFRWTHQMHHSVERVDVFASFYGHPFELIAQAVVLVVSFNVIVGLPPVSAAVAGAVSFGLNVFQHLNVHTPRWVGLFVQRPEAHNVHHQRGVHAWNYSDLPIWDILFGTYRNPSDFDGEIGFHPGTSSRIGAMLIGRDVSTI